MKHLLREYVRTLLEKIRSATFNLNDFKKLASPAEMLSYADEHLQSLGDGTTRSVYMLSSKKVLKIAQNSRKGVAQNKAEVYIWENPKMQPLVAKVFEHDSKYMWLVSELVRELHREEEFQATTGFPWDFFVDCLMDGSTLPEGWEPDDTQLAFWNKVQALLKADLVWGDLVRLNHWGKTADGRLVLLDYGYTGHVRDQTAGHKPFTDDASKEPDEAKIDWNDVNWKDQT